MTYEPAPLPANESARLKALSKYNILDTEPEKAFDDITRLASYICQTPIAMISLIDKERKWLKSKVGINVAMMARDTAICSHVILQEDLMVFPDLQNDELFKSNPNVTSAPFLRFYIGAPLITPDGFALGTICAVDKVPRQLSAEQIEAMGALSRQVVALLEFRLSAINLDEKNRELARKNEKLIESQQRADRIFSNLADALPGTVLDEKYHLDEKIGAGGFGAVFRATHMAMKRPIAVKIFKPSPGNDSAEEFARFQLEAVSTCKVVHPNAVSVLDSGISAEGIAYLVMELLNGYPLKSEMRRDKILSIERCAQILIPVCDVLSKAHAAGIIHRDIKPENIFLHHMEAEEVVKVVDFGIAKLMETDDSEDIKELTATGRIIGTPIYMSPERFDSKVYDGSCDIYSLGVMLYEMLCGRPPFLPGEGGILAIMIQHLTQPPPPINQFNAQIPKAVEAIVMRTMEKDPVNRPTAKELADALAEFKNQS